MLMSDLSRFLLVSNGNVTGIVDRLVSEGLVQRGQRNGDRRTSIVQLTRSRPGRFSRHGGGTRTLGRRTARRASPRTTRGS